MNVVNSKQMTALAYHFSFIISPKDQKKQEKKHDRQGAPKWPTGSGKGSTPKFWGAPVNFL